MVTFSLKTIGNLFTIRDKRSNKLRKSCVFCDFSGSYEEVKKLPTVQIYSPRSGGG